MGSVPVNDENLGVHPGGKHSSSDEIFAIEQPTGRQSILRQTENLPNKTVPKGGKVYIWLGVRTQQNGYSGSINTSIMLKTCIFYIGLINVSFSFNLICCF